MIETQAIGDDRLRLSVSRLCLGAMNFGTRVDEATSFAILDRFREAGGNFIDTANNYNQWLGGGQGGQSEELLGRWLASRDGAYDDMVVATKAGARTTVAGDPSRENYEGLSAKAIRSAAEGSLRRLGVERLDVYYAHGDFRSTPLEETVGTYAELAAAGSAGVIACSNHATWRLAEARRISAAHGWAAYTCVQQFHTYLWPRPGHQSVFAVSDELLDYAAMPDNADLTILCYSPLFAGYYARRHQPPSPATDYASTWRKLEVPSTQWDHASSWARLEVLDDVARELGATPNQVVLAWMLGDATPFIPIFSASSLDQLDEALGAVDLKLDPELRERLDNAG
jgi:aryl-alcohol dehydrogenase-like predicted oxidoreductase